ncbi:MAG: hypothetical protein WBI07_15150 [Mobilitalea sp.]
MVTVYYDKDNLYVGNADLVVSSYKEYSHGYAAILDAVYCNKNINVVVRNRQCYRTFQNVAEYYKINTFQFKTFSPRTEFVEKYGDNIPDYILEEELIADKSYLDVDFSAGEGFENTILRIYFDKFLVGKTFPFRMLGDMCKNMSLECLQNKELLILRKVFKNRIKEYTANCKGKYEEFVLNEFKEDYEGLRNNVALYLIIKGYPKEFIEDIIGHDLYRCFTDMKVSGERMPLLPGTMEAYKNRMSIFLNQMNVIDKEDFLSVLQCFSGEYAFEFQWCNKKLDEHSEWIDKELFDAVSMKFAALFATDSELKDQFVSLQAPVNLIRPNEEFDIYDWLKWAKENYLPYKFWLENTNKTNDIVDQYATMYGDWIFEHYDTLIGSYPNMMYKVLPGLKRELVENKHSLVVILDNFNYKLQEELQAIMQKNGFGMTYERPVLAMIPTETKISKRAFFTGEAYNENKQSYDKLVQHWAERMDLTMRYLSNIGELSRLDSFEENVIFLNFLEMDIKLHQDSGSSAISVEKSVLLELNALLERIASVLRKLGREKDTSIYFIADHGSTKILPEQNNLIDPAYYKDKQEESDYRFIAVNDVDYARTKDAIGGLCYTFDRNRYNTEYSYFIAKGYNRFIKSDLKSYVHGGITPEESIVPFMKFDFATEVCKEPEITLDNIDLRYSVVTMLSFTIKNFNDFALSDFVLEIKNKNIKYDKTKSIVIEGCIRDKFSISGARISKAIDKLNNEKMYITAYWCANGRKYSLELELPMKMKSMQQSKVDLSDLF